MGHKARAFDREHEIVGCLVMPAAKAHRLLAPVKGAVDLDRRDLPAGMRQFLRLHQAPRIEFAAPRREYPAADADSDGRVAAHRRITNEGAARRVSHPTVCSKGMSSSSAG